MSRHASEYRSYRKYWWLRPGVLLPALLLALLAVPVLLWIHSYGSLAADIMFATTYLSLTVWFIFFMKGNLLEPHIKVKTDVVEKKKRELQEDQRKHRAGIYADELRRLEAGQATPVLAVWQMDPSFAHKHPFVKGMRVCRIDPASREFQIRIHLGEEWTFAPDTGQSAKLPLLLASFIAFLGGHRDVKSLTKFFDTYIVEVHKMEDDGSLTGLPVPVLSYTAALEDVRLWLAESPRGDLPGVVRYSEGDVIEPHRNIEAL